MDEQDGSPLNPENQRTIWRARYLSARRGSRSDDEMARALGVKVESVPRWKDGEPPAPGRRDQLLGLDVAVEMLTGFLEPSSMRTWRAVVNQHLGGARPVDMIRQGRMSDAIQTIHAESTGNYG